MLLGGLLGFLLVNGALNLLDSLRLNLIIKPVQPEANSFLEKNIKYNTDQARLAKPITLMFTGDIMLSRAVGEKMKEKGDYRWPFLKIAPFLAQADIVFGNLEGPISERGRRVGSKYSFRVDLKAMEGLKFAGFNVLSVANNHIGDYAQEALEDTLFILNKNDIKYIGGGYNEKQAHQPVFITKQATTFAFLAYSDLGPKWTEAKGEKLGIAFYSENRMIEDIQKARQQADFVIVSFHFGNEYETKASARQEQIAKRAIEAGADIVVGHHPHVVQPVTEYDRGLIAYSLGNFIFDQTFSKETRQGLILKVVIKDKQIRQIEQIKTHITDDFQTVLE